VLPDFADFHISLNHDKANSADFSVKNSKVNLNVADLHISVYQNSQIW